MMLGYSFAHSDRVARVLSDHFICFLFSISICVRINYLHVKRQYVKLLLNHCRRNYYIGSIGGHRNLSQGASNAVMKSEALDHSS